MSRLACCLGLMGMPVLAWADELQISDAWVRETAGNQKSSGVFMVITAPTPVLIVGAHAEVAERVDLIEMLIADSGPMRPQRAKSLYVAGQEPTRMTPLTTYVLLAGLRQPLVAGQRVAVVLDLEGKGGKRFSQTFEATVRPFYLGTR